MKHFLGLSVILLSFLLGSQVFCQSLTPTSVNAAGNSMSQSSGSLNFTVGELVIGIQTDSEGNSLGGGVTSSAVVTSTFTSIEELSMENMDVNLFPNPTSDWLNIEFTEAPDKRITIELVNSQGKLLLSENNSAGQKRIQLDATDWAVGTYLIHIRSEESNAGASFQVIKSQ